MTSYLTPITKKPALDAGFIRVDGQGLKTTIPYSGKP
jgi:hypothetical protein